MTLHLDELINVCWSGNQVTFLPPENNFLHDFFVQFCKNVIFFRTNLNKNSNLYVKAETGYLYYSLFVRTG